MADSRIHDYSQVIAAWTLLLLLLFSGCDPHTEAQQDQAHTAGVSENTDPNQRASNPAQEQKLRDAAQKGHIQTVKLLVSQGTDVNAADQDLRTPLMWAAFDGYTDIVKMLLENGAQVDAQDGIGRTALMYAASGSNIDTVRALLGHKANTNIVDGHEAFTALMFAAAEGQTAVVRALLEHHADPNLKDTDGDTAYDFAMQNGHTETAQLVKPMNEQ